MFPFDKVKIDQCFIHDIVESAEARAIVNAVIGLGHGLNMLVVAEGVETRAQIDVLRSQGCDLVQGYLISKPKPMRHLDRMVLKASFEDELPVRQAA
jgi:EAL domain-containing protein (putative c-di-GMP-specific phosphodiesterase class I)